MRSIQPASQAACVCVCVELIEFFIDIDSNAAHIYNGNKFEKRLISLQLPLNEQREREVKNKSNRLFIICVHASIMKAIQYRISERAFSLFSMISKNGRSEMK